MAFTVGDRDVRPITADEAMEMVATGILAEDERVELLHGVLTRMSPNHPPHAGTVERLTDWLAPLPAARRAKVRVQLPFRVPDDTSLPEPDIAVVPWDDHVSAHPTTALLIIEVAHSSLKVDTKIKPVLYATAGVPEYWVVDVHHRRLERFREPAGDRYGVRTAHEPPESVEPEHVDVAPLDLSELLSGL